jgi:hypothetical protein
MWPEPWLLSCRCGDSMPPLYRQLHFTLFAKGTFRPFVSSSSWGTACLLEKQMAWVCSLCSSTHTTTSLQWGRVAIRRGFYVNTVILCCFYTCIVREQSKVTSRCMGFIVYIRLKRLERTRATTQSWSNLAAISLGVKISPFPQF